MLLKIIMLVYEKKNCSSFFFVLYVKKKKIDRYRWKDKPDNKGENACERIFMYVQGGFFFNYMFCYNVA